jgi:hypothetical protein
MSLEMSINRHQFLTVKAFLSSLTFPGISQIVLFGVVPKRTVTDIE